MLPRAVIRLVENPDVGLLWKAIATKVNSTASYIYSRVGRRKDSALRGVGPFGGACNLSRGPLDRYAGGGGARACDWCLTCLVYALPFLGSSRWWKDR